MEENHAAFISMVKACILTPSKKTKSLDQMVSNPHVKMAAYEIFELPKLLARPKFKLSRNGGDGILLHGPPGTGKRAIAQAMALQACYTLIKVPTSKIRSRFVGDSEK